MRFVNWCNFVLLMAEYSSWSRGQDSPQVEESNCHFPDSIQGAYRTQDNEQHKFQQGSFISELYELRDPIKYKDLYIGPSSIPLWGDCEEKHGDAYVLKLKKVGGYVCYRCFVIIQRTQNVLQACTAAENACYETATEARQRCVDVKTVQPYEGMILYRSEHIQYQHCPVGGKAMMKYSISGGRLHCPYPSTEPSTINNCKYGYQLDISLRGCTFPSYDVSFRCLGTWDAGKGNGEKYFAIYNPAADEYRCGLYSEVRQSDVYAVAALTNDSSCSNSLISSANGYEYFAFFKDPSATETMNGSWHGASAIQGCEFPPLIRGDWETMNVDRDAVSFYYENDPSTMSTIYGKCGDAKDEKLKIITRSHCGGAMGETCMWWKVRSAALMEVKLVHLTTSTNAAPTCFYDATYANTSWSIVASRGTGKDKLVPCPFYGQFSTVSQYQRRGRYCYNVTSDCNQPYRFRLIKYLCGSDDVFDVSNFECMASWLEDNTRFTFVNRTDNGITGCIASQTDANGHIYINRMTKQCQRKLDFALLFGVGRFEGPVIAVEEISPCPRTNSAAFPSFDGDGQLQSSGKPNWTGRNRHSDGARRGASITLMLLSIFLVFYEIAYMKPYGGI